MVVNVLFVMGVVFVGVLPCAGYAACHNSGDSVTVAGTIHMNSRSADDGTGETKSWTYPVITLDQPICVKDARWGDVPDGKAASIMVFGEERKLTEGEHTSLRGALSVRSSDTQPPEELMLLISNIPPDAPGKDEIALDVSHDKSVTACANSATKIQTELGAQILKIITTWSPRWGTIWRADSSHPLPDGYPPMLWRIVCWKKTMLDRPLQMFDPSKSIPPLQ